MTNLLNKIIDPIVAFFNPYSVLTHDEIICLIDKGYLVADRDKVNATSIDVTLHEDFMVEGNSSHRTTSVDLATREVPRMEPRCLTDLFGCMDSCMYNMQPGEFILGATNEIFNLPDNITAVFYMKSSLARCGLDHCNAGFIDPGFNGSRLTLELTNLLRTHKLGLRYRMPIGQIKFYRHKFVPAKFSYRKTGQYNGDMAVQDSKGVR